MSSSVLNRRLCELRDAGLVARHASGYMLTSMGSDLVLLLSPLDAWARRWSTEVGKSSGPGEVDREPDDAPGRS